MEKSRPHVDLSATCACGQVSVRFAGPVKSMFMCACEDCQKATGTGHSTVALANRADVTIAGEVRSFDRPSNSGATFTRHFCPTCGTPLYGVSSRAPEALLLPVGLFGKDNAWFMPTQLIFGRSHREWDELAAGVPRYQTYRDEEAR
ncbi:MAG TPA: GFA family protein [Devosia sp.]|jgi:hypothetical protein|nr:GFA family protein [Devosia sp.]